MTWLRFFSVPPKICMVSSTIPNRKQKTNPIAERAEYNPKSRQKENPLQISIFYGGLESVEVFDVEIEQLSLDILTEEFTGFLISYVCVSF